MPKRRPNFVCFVTDQQRADHLGCMGHPMLRTPNIDRIANRGVRFTDAYVSNPLCMPSRATMFTGRTPRGHRVRTNGIPLDPAIPTMTDALRNAGYRTHGVGKIHLHTFGTPKGGDPAGLEPTDFPESAARWQSGAIDKLPQPYYGLETVDFVGGHGSWHFGEHLNWLKEEHPEAVPLLLNAADAALPSGAEQSWKSALPVELHPSRWIADRTIEFLRDAARGDQPFFLWCSFPDPHHPYCPPEPYASMYAPADVPMPVRREGELARLAPFFGRAFEKGMPLSGRFRSTKVSDQHIREILALTFGMVSLIDDCVGRVLAVIEELGLARDTVITFFSDHGDMMGDHWMLNKGPFHFNGLLRVPFLWSWPGHFPEGAVTRGLASMLDFAPTLLDLAAVPVPEGVTPPKPECPAQPAPWPGVSLVPQLRGDVASVQKSVLVENDEDYLGYRLRTLITDRQKLTIYPGQNFGELFDLENDPDELENLWSSPRHRELREQLMIQLLQRIVLTDCPQPRRLSHA